MEGNNTAFSELEGLLFAKTNSWNIRLLQKPIGSTPKTSLPVRSNPKEEQQQPLYFANCKKRKPHRFTKIQNTAYIFAENQNPNAHKRKTCKTVKDTKTEKLVFWCKNQKKQS